MIVTFMVLIGNQKLIDFDQVKKLALEKSLR